MWFSVIFCLTHTDTGFTLLSMDKDEIKQKLLQVVKSDPYFSDIKSIAVFGSQVTGEAGLGSDVDVLVEFNDEAHIGFFKYVRIQRMLGKALDATVDLLTPQAISKYFRDEVLAQAEYFYER